MSVERVSLNSDTIFGSLNELESSESSCEVLWYAVKRPLWVLLSSESEIFVS